MPRPINVENLFELNPNSQAVYYDNYVCIDDFYKNYDEIIDVIENSPAESWKKSQWSRNFIDYYDCRLVFANWQPDPIKVKARTSAISSLVCNLLNIDRITMEKSLQFNVFKHIKNNVPEIKQHHPHYDIGMINVLVYLDRHANGGTALYKDREVVNNEASNLIVDISDYEIEEIIPAKPNRCVIFSGAFLHGAYIENNKVYEDNWRVTQATILRLDNDE